MGKSVRFILLAIGITIILTVTLVHGISSAIEQGSWHIARTHPCRASSTSATMVVATLLCFYRANIGAEARCCPRSF